MLRLSFLFLFLFSATANANIVNFNNGVDSVLISSTNAAKPHNGNVLQLKNSFPTGDCQTTNNITRLRFPKNDPDLLALLLTAQCELVNVWIQTNQ